MSRYPATNQESRDVTERAWPAEFRSHVREFIHTALPPALAGVTGFAERARAYRAALHRAGLAGLGIPAEFGGQGLGEAEERIFAEESAGSVPGEDRVFQVGARLVVPSLIGRGAHDLAREFGPGLLSGEMICCQLFSEPEAGSDLAGVRTRAARTKDGDWLVTGQKVWTSYAQYAGLGLLLARTDAEAPKHHGLSMFLVDMDAPGVEVRPLRQMSGDCEFNEVFFDEVRVPADRLVGRPGEGWPAAVAVLGHERVGVSRGDDSSPRRPIPYERLLELARHGGRDSDPVVRERLLDAFLGQRTAALVSRRIAARTLAGAEPGPETSVGKLLRTANGLHAARLASDVALGAGATWAGDDTLAADAAFWVLDAPGMAMGGGTDEIQRNTIGERVLGLPREHSVERGVPFRDLVRTREGQQ